jgi:hypothetical protein
MAERDRTHSFGMQCADHRWVIQNHRCACGVTHGSTLVECNTWCPEYLTPEQRNAQRRAEGW